MQLIAPSILSADFSKLGEDVRLVEAAGADWIHVDVMDGHFVPNITMGPLVVNAVKQVTTLPLDVHLMIAHPERYISEFASAGAQWLCVQAEACTHLNRTVQLIRQAGARPGVALNPATPLSAVEWVLEMLDYVLVMTVNPGFGGQVFIENCLDKIRALRNMIDSHHLPTLIQVDGGINAGTAAAAAAAGADVFVAGSAIFGTNDYAAAISTLRTLIEANAHGTDR